MTAAQTDYVPWIDPATGRIDGVVIVSPPTSPSSARPNGRCAKAKSRFRRIANSAPALMWVTRLDRRRDFVNDTYAEFACGPGFDPEDARLLDWRSKIHPDDVDRVVSESLAGEASLQPFTLRHATCRHDGDLVVGKGSPAAVWRGRYHRLHRVGSDITLAKEAELELRRQVEERTAQLAASEAQFRAVFEAALEVMVLLKPDGTVLAVNDRREVWRYEKSGTKRSARSCGMPPPCRPIHSTSQ